MRKLLPFAVVALAFVAVACSKKEPTMGEKLDNAMEKAGEKAGEAGKKIEDATKK